MADSYLEDVTSEAEEEMAGQATEETAEEEGNDGGPRKKSRMAESKPRKSRFLRTFTGTG
jgi:hypothetical protein